MREQGRCWAKAQPLHSNPPGCESKEDAGLKPSAYMQTHSPGNKLVSRLFPSITDGVNRRQLLGSKQAKARLCNARTIAMKISKTNAVLIWKQLEDVLVPRLGLTLAERAVYSHLLRHSRLEDRLRLRFSILWLARGNRLSAGSVRLAVRRLVTKGALRLVERTKAGHVVEVRLPGEIRAIRPDRIAARGTERLQRAANLEETDFLKDKTLREAIHTRERSVCFYCL